MENTTKNITKNTDDNAVCKYKYLTSFIKKCYSISGIYIMWIIIHHLAANLYARYCTPLTLVGVLSAPFIVATPPCSCLRWCINKGSDTMVAMWVVMASWLVTRVSKNN